MKRVIFLPVVLLLSVSCASMKSVSLTQIPKMRENPVSVTVEKWIFLAFNFENDFVDTIQDELRSKCKNGEVRGILTKDEEYNYFLLNKRVVTAKGYCIK